MEWRLYIISTSDSYKKASSSEILYSIGTTLQAIRVEATTNKQPHRENDSLCIIDLDHCSFEDDDNVETFSKQTFFCQYRVNSIIQEDIRCRLFASISQGITVDVWILM